MKETQRFQKVFPMAESENSPLVKFYTVPEAAKKIRMSSSWIRQKIFSKEILVLKIGRRVFIPKSTILEILEQGIVEPKKSTIQPSS